MKTDFSLRSGTWVNIVPTMYAKIRFAPTEVKKNASRFNSCFEVMKYEVSFFLMKVPNQI